MPAPSASSPVKIASAASPEKAALEVKIASVASPGKAAASSEKAVLQVKAALTEAPEPKTFLSGASRAPCAPFLAGRCQQGDECPYNHDRTQIFGTSALDEPSPQQSTTGRQSKNKRQFHETKNSENSSPNKAKKNDSAGADKNGDQGSSPKRARLAVEETKQQLDQEDGQEGQYWGFYEGEETSYWEDEYSMSNLDASYEFYDNEGYGYNLYDESWEGDYGEYYECWAEEEY